MSPRNISTLDGQILTIPRILMLINMNTGPNWTTWAVTFHEGVDML